MSGGDGTGPGSDTDELGPLFAEDHAGGASEQRAAARVRAALLGDVAALPGMARFRLRRVLGEGAMGQVWLADDPELGRQVAIKLLATSSGPRIDVHAQRLAREARAMAKVSHPNVLPVFDVGTTRDSHDVFIVMEYVDGETLAAWMMRPHSPSAVVAMFLQCAAGLDAAHRVGLVHRDFKPANVLVGRDGRARVADFGLARTDHEALHKYSPASDEGELSITQGASLTASGGVVGTPLYMSPEQHTGGVVDVRSDQYAFCVALYEALAGRRAFVGTIREVTEAKLAASPLPIPPGRHVPERVLAVVRRGLAVAPQHRWPSMAALAAALRRANSPVRRRIAMLAVASDSAAGLLGATLPERPDGCALAAPKWDDVRRRELEVSLFESVGPEQSKHVVRRIDDVATSWRDAAGSGCTASTAVQLCLRDAATQIDRAVELLADGVPSADAASLVEALARPGDCAALAANDRSATLGPRELELRDALATAHTTSRSGRIDEALEQLHGIREEAVASGEPGRWVAARAALQLGETYAKAELPHDASPWFRVAFFEASAIGDDNIALLSAAPLAAGEAIRRDSNTADEWLRHAEVLAARTPPSAGAFQVLHAARGAIAAIRDDNAAAEAEFRLLMRWADDQGLVTAWIPAARNLGVVLLRSGDNASAIELYRELVRRVEAVYGPDHFETASRRAELAAILVSHSRDEAIVELRRAIETLQSATVRRTGPLSTALRGLALALADAGRYEEAIAASEQSLASLASADPDNYVRRAIYLASLAGIRTDAGDYVGAARDLEVASGLLEDWSGTERAVVEFNVADLAARRGDVDLAVANYTAARNRWLELGGSDIGNILVAYTNEAVLLHRHGRCAESLARFDEAKGFARARDERTAELELEVARTVAVGDCGSRDEARRQLAEIRRRCAPGSIPAAYAHVAAAELAGPDEQPLVATELAAAAAITSATGSADLLRHVREAYARLLPGVAMPIDG